VTDTTSERTRETKVFLKFTISKFYTPGQVPEGECRCRYDLILNRKQTTSLYMGENQLKVFAVVVTLFQAGNSHIAAVYMWYKLGFSYISTDGLQIKIILVL